MCEVVWILFLTMQWPNIVQILCFICKYHLSNQHEWYTYYQPSTLVTQSMRQWVLTSPLHDCCASIEPATPLPCDDEASWRQCFWKPARPYIKRCFRPQPRHTPFNSPLETTISAQWRYDHIFTNIYLILFQFFVFHNLQKKKILFLFFKNLWNSRYLSI